MGARNHDPLGTRRRAHDGACTIGHATHPSTMGMLKYASGIKPTSVEHAGTVEEYRSASLDRSGRHLAGGLVCMFATEMQRQNVWCCKAYWNCKHALHACMLVRPSPSWPNPLCMADVQSDMSCTYCWLGLFIILSPPAMHG